MFHEKLKHLREHQELSQKEVCRRIGLPCSTYSRYEGGDTQKKFAALRVLAKKFDVSVDYLLDNQVPSENELVALEDFIRHGNYTVCGKFLTDKERKKLIALIELVFKE